MLPGLNFSVTRTRRPLAQAAVIVPQFEAGSASSVIQLPFIDGYLPYRSPWDNSSNVWFRISGIGLTHYLDGSDLVAIVGDIGCEIVSASHNFALNSMPAGVFRAMVEVQMQETARRLPRSATSHLTLYATLWTVSHTNPRVAGVPVFPPVAGFEPVEPANMMVDFEIPLSIVNFDL